MDYTRADYIFKIKKVLRYLSIYGFRRTLIKVRGQYHMQRKNVPQKLQPTRKSGKRHIAIIGCGNYSYSNIAYYLKKNYGNVISTCLDIDMDRTISLGNDYGVPHPISDAKAIYSNPDITLVYIASNHSTHAEYAIQSLKSGKSVHIEKPHVVSHDQNDRLYSAYISSGRMVNLGFNRPNSRFGKIISSALSEDEGPMMISWFIAGHKIEPDHWYFREEEGGRILGNLCHWTDYTLRMIEPKNRYPLKIVPVKYEKSDSDVIANYIFGDGSIASILFSAKGHTFEGVREKLMVHRGDTLVWMEDFRTLTIEKLDKKVKYRNIYRDQGHEGNIMRSYELQSTDSRNPCSPAEVYETGHLFLKTKEALDTNNSLIIHQNELKE
jgi:predicted dehydrogenase